MVETCAGSLWSPVRGWALTHTWGVDAITQGKAAPWESATSSGCTDSVPPLSWEDHITARLLAETAAKSTSASPTPHM